MPSAAKRLELSTIGRPIDWSTRTNRAIAYLSLLALIAGLVAALFQRTPVGQSVLQGLRWGAATFLAWALGRECDPDHPISAFFASAGALVSAITLGSPNFLFAFWFLLAMRYINRSTGLPPGILDFGALYGIKFLLGFSAHWTIPLLTFPTVFFGDIQRFPRWARYVLPLIMPAAAVILGFTRGWSFAIPQWGWLEIAGLVGITLLMIPVLASYRVVLSVGDRSEQPLKPHRVQWAIGWISLAALILTLTGTASIQELAPIWAALAGTFLGWLIQSIQGFARSPKSQP